MNVIKTFGFVFLFLNSFLFFGTPVVEWLGPKEHDFGDIKQGKPVEYIFKFKNISDEPFIIDNIRSTCGCTAPDWSAEPVESNSENEIKITYDARKEGYFKKKVKVFFSTQRKAEVLYVEGFVEEKETR